jgi:hypothetical protein
MSKKTSRAKSQKMVRNKTVQAVHEQTSSPTGLTPRISYKNALILITICSIALAGLTIFQYGPVAGWVKGFLYGLLYGVLVWGVFFISLLIFRWLKKKQGL